MARPKYPVRAVVQQRTRQEWQRFEKVGLKPYFDLDQIVLNWIDARVIDLDVTGAVTSLNLSMSIEEAPTVTMSLRDPDGKLFRRGTRRWEDGKLGPKEIVAVDQAWRPINSPDLKLRALDFALDGVTFRLVKVSWTQSTSEWQLTFEHRLVAWLRNRKGVRKADRNLVTRAEFVLALLQELPGLRGRYRFVCPELHVKQPISAAAPTETNPTPGEKDDETETGGFSARANIKVKGATADGHQRAVANDILTEATRLGASREVRIACIMCATQESTMGQSIYRTGNDDVGVFQQGRNWIGINAVKDVAKGTRAFLLGHEANVGGTSQVQGWKQRHGSLKRVPGSYESAIKAVQISVGQYAQWQSEATRTVDAWGGPGSTKPGESVTVQSVKQYQYSRNDGEDSWTAMKRLGDEVAWRRFIVGNSLYFMSEEQLYERRVRYALSPDDEALLDLSYEVDWGKAVAKCSVQVSLDRWGAPPGSVVELHGFGPANGRWLVTSVSRDWFKPVADVEMMQPTSERPEPANEVETETVRRNEADPTSTTEGSKEDRAKAAARQIHDMQLPYAWGGGHGTGNKPSRSTRPGENQIGYDCSGSTGKFLKLLGLGGADPAVHSSAFGSLPGAQSGRGDVFTVWYDNGHVYVNFEFKWKWDRLDTSGSGEGGPRLRTGDRIGGGKAAASWKGW